MQKSTNGRIDVVKILIGCVVLFVAWISGVFGFAQIIGSLQNLRIRGPAMSAFTIILWVLILGAICFVAHHFFFPYRIVYYVGTGISFIQVLCSGRIE